MASVYLIVPSRLISASLAGGAGTVSGVSSLNTLVGDLTLTGINGIQVTNTSSTNVQVSSVSNYFLRTIGGNVTGNIAFVIPTGTAGYGLKLQNVPDFTTPVVGTLTAADAGALVFKTGKLYYYDGAGNWIQLTIGVVPRGYIIEDIAITTTADNTIDVSKHRLPYSPLDGVTALTYTFKRAEFHCALPPVTTPAKMDILLNGVSILSAPMQINANAYDATAVIPSGFLTNPLTCQSGDTIQIKFVQISNSDLWEFSLLLSTTY